MRLFSYCVQTDDGAAPNPFFGACTLVICKPRIRLVAERGDWVLGTGSKIAPQGDLSGRVVYAMRVDQAMPMKDYDAYARRHLPGKLPDPQAKDWRRRLGDAIYDFRTSPPTIRSGVHTLLNRARDLSGRNALISRYFWYFGASGPRLPPTLRELAQQRPGHRSLKNDPLKEAFVTWIQRQGPRGVRGDPQRAPTGASTCSPMPKKDLNRHAC